MVYLHLGPTLSSIEVSSEQMHGTSQLKLSRPRVANTGYTFDQNGGELADQKGLQYVQGITEEYGQ